MHATQSAVAALLASLAALVSGASASDTQVLVIHSDSLTSVKFGSPTPVQGARPLHLQRGVGIDGTLRLGSVFGWSLAGNPSGEPVGATASLSGLSLSTGAWSVTDVDLALPAERPWVVGRSYNARQRTSGDAHHDGNGYQGRNWFQMCQPEIVLYDDQDDALDVLYLVYGADRFVEFRRVDLGEETYSSTTWRAVNGAAGLFEHTRDTGSGPDTWTYYDSAGSTAVFFGFDDDDGGSSPDAAGAAGQLWKVSDPAGSTAYVGHETTISTAISNGYDASGRILEAFDSAGRRYCYTYSAIDSVTRLTQVIAETDAGGGWGDCGTETLVGKVEYAYYQTGDNTYGDNGCLKLVTVTTPLSDSGVSLVAKTLYRYWKGEFNDSTNPGHPYALQYVVGAEGYRRADWQDATFDDDPLTMTETNLKPYASASFEYDSSHRVDKAWFNGECGCSGGLNGTYDLAYETDDDYTDTSGYQSAWARRTVVERPDATYETRYFDETGQPLSRVVTDAHPGNTDPAPSAWATKIVRDASGLVTHVHTPANENGYAHDDVNGPDGTITSHTTAGLIRYYPRTASGDLTGFLDGERWKVGTTTTDANSTWSWSVDRNKKSKTVGDGTVHNPYVEKRRLYYTATSSKGTLGTGNASSSDVSGYSGNALVTEVLTSTQPCVPTGENGSGAGNAVSTYFNPDSRPAFTKSATGIIGYRAYNGLGLVATSVEDADTTQNGSGQVFEGVTIPSTPVNFAKRGTPLHEVTRYTYDAQGRLDETTLPDGRVTKRYFTRLADGRLVTISIPKYVSGTGTFHGPASYTVTNLAGRSEFSGTIALTTTTTALTGWIDETKADPVEALGVGSLSGVATSVYDTTGTRLDESRAYFAVPGSPYLPGTAGTHYDATLYGYDDMGRRRRVKDATGTIQRTVYDVLGRAVESWVGTNDVSFSGGATSGTDNMVMTEVREYDGGNPGGNSLLTKVKRDADGNWGTTTDQRVTEFLHDARGRVVVTLNPLAPHSLVKYDEQGNVTAAAAYSATSGLDASDDPTTLATNRVTLSTTLLDVLGRPYETRQYKINQSSGAIVQESSNDVYIRGRTWYDPEGRVMKSVGATIAKTRHARLGRATHQWTIASDDDTQYGHASESTAIWNTTDYQTSAAGDIVVTESRTTFEALTGHVIMTAVIERLFDDRDTGETTGPLDTNADGDDLLYTAANVKGRIRITGMWHDELGRLTDTVEFGTYGGSNFDRDGLSVPARSDTALRTTVTYNADGTRLEVEDPAGTKTRWVYDDARRVVTEIGNYVDGTPSGVTGDDDHHVRHVYTNGLRTKLWVDLDGDGTEDADDQVTVYTYGVSTSDTPGASKIASNGLLRQVTYPDSGSSDDVVRFAYNALGEVVWTRDQAGTVVETDYDLAGRVLHRRATATGSGIDTAVLRISTAYTARGRVETVTQHTSATVGSGSVVDEVEYAYDEWGQVTAFDQDWNSAISADALSVEYTHALALSQGSGVYRALRTTGTTLPDTTAVAYTYDSSGGRHDADLGRVSRVQVGATDVARYEYNGLATLVGTALLEADLLYTRYDLNGDFTRIDRFGRVTEDVWSRGIDTGGSPAYDVYRDLYDVDVAWDRASNVTRVEDNVYDGWDVGYALDGRDRLTQAERGT
ncbi:MAG: hypothetical protein KIS87_04400 [Phycisphaeraceae bacterium]|nr:hypothetical protein [Phycisphaeraceae bacterium]